MIDFVVDIVKILSYISYILYTLILSNRPRGELVKMLYSRGSSPAPHGKGKNIPGKKRKRQKHFRKRQKKEGGLRKKNVLYIGGVV